MNHTIQSSDDGFRLRKDVDLVSIIALVSNLLLMWMIHRSIPRARTREAAMRDAVLADLKSIGELSERLVDATKAGFDDDAARRWLSAHESLAARIREAIDECTLWECPPKCIEALEDASATWIRLKTIVTSGAFPPGPGTYFELSSDSMTTFDREVAHFRDASRRARRGLFV